MTAPDRSPAAGLLDGLRPHSAALIVLLISLTATAAVAWQLDRTIQTKDEERFINAVDRLQDSIVTRLGTYVAMLRAGAALIDVSAELGAGDFHDFVARLELQQRYPGIQGIGFTRRVRPDGLEALVAARRRAGDTSFRVWPDYPRDEYHSIVYLEPLDVRNRAAIGYDMFTEPTRKEAMARARDTGEPAASGPVILVQEIDEDKQPGFLIYMPVYEDGERPGTVDARRERLIGFVYSPFRTHDLFDGIFGSDVRPRAGFQLHDAAAPDVQMYATGAPTPAAAFATTRRIDVAGRPWTASFFSLPGLEESSTADLVPIVSWVGVGLSLLVTALVALQSASRHRLQVSERATQQALEAAREQAATLELVNATGAQLAGELELDRLVQAITDAGTGLTRAQFGAFFYNTTDAQGERFLLYSLSGAPRDKFAGFSMPRNTPLFAPTFRGEAVVRSDDVTKDSRYGRMAPHHGMPPGHLPVRSYLAVPVVSRSGEVIGGLFFGHAEVGVFTEQHERVIAGVAAQAAIAIDNARLYNKVQELLSSERSARGQAERESRVKDEFLATLSHELRTPLNAIQGWAQMLSTTPMAEPRKQQAIATILRNAQLQAHLIDDLLDMSRIVSGRVQLETEILHVGDLLETALAVVGPDAQAKRIRIASEFEVPGPPVRADARRLQQVFGNLLANAIKFTPDDGQVTVSVRSTGTDVEIAVRDTGTGIAPEFLPWVFERFRQADGSIARRHGGLGLGLSIVKSLVGMHGGSVRAESEGHGRGSTFTVQLPLADAAGPAFTRHAPTLAMLPLSADVLAGLGVLVVDDDTDGRELLCDILTQYGAQVTEAASATAALRLLETGSYQVLVSDLGMPEMDGYQLIREIRRRTGEPMATIPAVALTAYAAAEDRTRALAAGYHLHLAKPFVPHEAVAACAVLTGRVTV